MSTGRTFLPLLTKALLFAAASGDVFVNFRYDRVIPADDLLFTTSTLFHHVIDSVHRCSQLCGSARQCQCVAFTFVIGTGECRGYSAQFDGGMPQAGARTYTLVSDPCSACSHTLMDDARRHVDSTLVYGTFSSTWPAQEADNNLTPGWYRFRVNGTRNGVIPTYCVAKQHCSSGKPEWLDLQGGSLPEAGLSKEVLSCTALKMATGKCCVKSQYVTVRNCGAFYVYRLLPTLSYNTIYCVHEQV